MSRRDRVHDWFDSHHVFVLFVCMVAVLANFVGLVWAVMADSWYAAIVTCIIALLVIGLAFNEFEMGRERQGEGLFDEDYE